MGFMGFIILGFCDINLWGGGEKRLCGYNLGSGRVGFMGSARVKKKKDCSRHVFCDCHCHNSSSVKHCWPCCHKCLRCGRNVKWDR